MSSNETNRKSICVFTAPHHQYNTTLNNKWTLFEPDVPAMSQQLDQEDNQGFKGHVSLDRLPLPPTKTLWFTASYRARCFNSCLMSYNTLQAATEQSRTFKVIYVELSMDKCLLMRPQPVLQVWSQDHQQLIVDLETWSRLSLINLLPPSVLHVPPLLLFIFLFLWLISSLSSSSSYLSWITVVLSLWVALVSELSCSEQSDSSKS